MALTDPFPEPWFTPSTKAAEGHDLNIDWDSAALIVGSDVLERAAALCVSLFTRASDALAQSGLVLADTKFELGFVDGELVVCDEVMTPDSSRIWPAAAIRPGETPPSFDKQPFRDWLSDQPWDKTPPPPPVPSDIVDITAERYRECYRLVAGRALSDWYGGNA
jgi:phosphoribosylaminoimidazole-succinocarboxamide synthase